MMYTKHMNKLVLLIVILTILAGGYFVSQPQRVMTPQTTPIAIEEQNNSRYVNYSKSTFAAARGKKRVYYFHAPWCPTCVPADKEFQTNQADIPEDVILFKTDYDSSEELKKRYSITYQHTFVLVDENENEIKKWNGGAINELIANTR